MTGTGQFHHGQEKYTADNVFSYYDDIQKSLQDVNELCSHICETSLSLVNLFDSDYQYTVSHYGDWEYKTLPMDKTICTHTVKSGKLLVIKDVNYDDRTKHITFPENCNIRFYAGIPIRDAAGKIFATLCVMSSSPRGLSRKSQQSFEIMAKHLESLLITYDAQKNKEENIKKDVEIYLQDEELMVLEVHHRIKNNLADICGMLQIERSETTDANVKRVLTKAENRLIAAFKLHELLYESQNLVQINLKNYIEQLVEMISRISENEKLKITYDINVEEIFLDFSHVFPLGLIVNELVTNAVQHAFINRKTGYILIVIKEGKKGAIQMQVKDDGKGSNWRKKINDDENSQYGLEIINLLAKQINAKIDFDLANGTSFSLEFFPRKDERKTTDTTFSKRNNYKINHPHVFN